MYILSANIPSMSGIFFKKNDECQSLLSQFFIWDFPFQKDKLEKLRSAIKDSIQRWPSL